MLPAQVSDRIQHIIKMDSPTLGQLRSQIPFVSVLGGSGLDKVADLGPVKQTGLMNVPHYSKQRWLYSNIKISALFKLN